MARSAGWPAAHSEVLRFDTLTCPADLDRDGDIDLANLAQLLATYGMNGGATCHEGDLNGDGSVGLADLAALLGAYGATCTGP